MCDHGIIQITIGYPTLRLDPRAYSELADTVRKSLKLQAANKSLIH
jgi:hypothetical protein